MKYANNKRGHTNLANPREGRQYRKGYHFSVIFNNLCLLFAEMHTDTTGEDLREPRTEIRDRLLKNDSCFISL